MRNKGLFVISVTSRIFFGLPSFEKLLWHFTRAAAARRQHVPCQRNQRSRRLLRESLFGSGGDHRLIWSLTQDQLVVRRGTSSHFFLAARSYLLICLRSLYCPSLNTQPHRLLPSMLKAYFTWTMRLRCGLSILLVSVGRQQAQCEFDLFLRTFDVSPATMRNN